MKLFRPLLVLFASLAMMPAVLAQTDAPAVSNSPDRTTATFGDWTLRCETPSLPAGAARICEVAQAIQMQGQQDPIAQLAIGRIAPAEPLKLTLVLPTNVTLTAAPSFATQEKDGELIATVWQRCLPGGCFADVALSDETVDAMRAGAEPGRIEFRDASGRDIKLPFSLRGFAQAMDGLSKE